MIRDNVWFQLVLFLIFVFSGLFYVVRGAKEGEKKRLICGIFLLTFAWNTAILLLERWGLNPFFKNALEISEIAVPLASIIVAAIYIKTWRPYILGLGLLLVIVIGVTYMRISPGSPKISLRT